MPKEFDFRSGLGGLSQDQRNWILQLFALSAVPLVIDIARASEPSKDLSRITWRDELNLGCLRSATLILGFRPEKVSAKFRSREGGNSINLHLNGFVVDLSLENFACGYEVENSAKLEPAIIERRNPEALDLYHRICDEIVNLTAPSYVPDISDFHLNGNPFNSTHHSREVWYTEYWYVWYQGFLDGKPLDWELQRRVALINDAIWEAGPEAVAEEIERIRAKFELERRIQELEAERDALIAEKSRHGIGGNNPPDDQKIEAEVVETVTLIWADIDALKEETKKDSPIKAVVAAIIERLGAGLKRLMALCGRLGEHALKVVVGTIAATGTVGFLKPELLEAVIEAAKRWVATL